MAVLEAFARNLRLLTAIRGSQASVANDLDIGRIQFQRYLRSESFPKPNSLKSICDYFGVDARIFTEPLTEDQLLQVGKGQPIADTIPPAESPFQRAMAYAVANQDYFASGPTHLPDGVYQLWRGSFARSDMAHMQLIQVHTIGDAKVFRGYDPKELHPLSDSYVGRQREFRGIILPHQEGFTLLTFHAPPSQIVSFAHVTTADLGNVEGAAGFWCLSRSAMPNRHRLVRCLFIEVKGGWPELMKARRLKRYVPWDEVPEQVLYYIKPRNEQF